MKKIDLLNVKIPALETTKEGMLRGGFCCLNIDYELESAMSATNENCKCPVQPKKGTNKNCSCPTPSKRKTNSNCQCPAPQKKQTNANCDCPLRKGDSLLF